VKPSNFRIVPLSTAIADAARRAAEAGAPDHRTVKAESPNALPCRHCLQWAKPGELMVLFPFQSISSGHPYAESGPIFVHAEPCARYQAMHEYPADFREGRVVRAYNSQEDMIDAEVVNGTEPEAIIEKFLQNPETDFIQVRSVSRGCFTMKIERV
jgi:hypothetical protein